MIRGASPEAGRRTTPGGRNDVSTKKEIRAKLQEMVDRLDQAGDDARNNLAKAMPNPKMIQIDVTDLDVSYWTEIADGQMDELREGEADHVDIRLRAASDDLVKMINGELGLMSSYLSGRIRIEASLSDLLALRKLA